MYLIDAGWMNSLTFINATMNQSNIYIPLLAEYCKQNEDTILFSGYPYLPFIPVAFKNYEKSCPKIFYVGIDTYYWNKSIDKLIDCYKNEHLSEILTINNKVVTPKRILEEWHGDKGVFWEFVCKLHLYIRTGCILKNDDLRSLSQEEVAMIEEIGYGNMNSIELQSTLGPQKEDIWDSINESLYWQLKHFSEQTIDPIENLIMAYDPDYIVIFGWGGTKQHVFKGLKYFSITDAYEDGFRALYTLYNYKAKIVWTSHPRRFSFLKTNQDEMVLYIGNSIKLFT